MPDHYGADEDGYEPYFLLHWGRSLRLGSPGIKLVLQILCERADQFGMCYPGQESLAAESEQKPRAVREQLAILEALGIITRQHRYDGRGKRTSDIVTLQARVVLMGTDFTERVRQHRPGRALPADSAASPNRTVMVDVDLTTGTGQHPLPAPDDTHYRHPGAREVTEEVTRGSNRNHLEDATTGESGSVVDNPDSSAAPSDSERTPDRSDVIRARALGASRRNRRAAS